jgi:hypothetical protein
MRSSSRNLSLLAVVALGGCSQIIGLSDYDIEGTPSTNAGQASTDGGEPNGSAGEPSGGGTRNHAGQPGNDAGAGNAAQGGRAGSGGSVTAAGAGNGGEAGAPVVTPPVCTTSACCKNMGGVAVATELLVDGGFENNPATWGTSPSNIFTEATANTINAHSGKWFAWLGGEVNDVSVLLSPDFTAPEDTGWLVVAGYYWLKFDTNGKPGDFVDIEMYDSTGDFSNPEESFFHWSTSGSDTSSWKAFSKEFPVKGYTTGTYDIAFTGVTDSIQDDPNGQLASNFFFDDISLKAYRCQL